MKRTIRLQIEFGSMAKKIAEQITIAGFTADEVGIAHCQKDADALTRLSVRGVLTDSAIRNGRNKLMAHIARYCEPRQGGVSDHADE